MTCFLPETSLPGWGEFVWAFSEVVRGVDAVVKVGVVALAEGDLISFIEQDSVPNSWIRQEAVQYRFTVYSEDCIFNKI